jgi:hypothetical protein
MIHCRLTNLLLVSAFLIGCDGSKSALKGGKSTTSQEFCASIEQAAIALQTRCIGGDDAFWRYFYSKLLDCSRLDQKIKTGLIVYDPALGAACLDQIAKLDCSHYGEVVACTSALAGQVAPGGSCSRDPLTFTECAPGSHCHYGDVSCFGICQADAPIGAACGYGTGSSYVDCVDGASCNYDTDLCVANAAEGQACGGTTAASCDYGLYCEGFDSNVAGTCRKQKTSGACTDGTECASNHVCTGAQGNKTCNKAKLPGETCTPGQHECYNVISWCGADGKCTSTLLQEDQACGEIQGEYAQCDVGLYCYAASGSTGTCKKEKAAGTSCTYDGECAGTGGYCDSTNKLCVACE